MVSLSVHDQQLKTKTERKLGDFNITIPILWNITSSPQSRHPLPIWASWPWPLTPLTEINRFPDLNIQNFRLKFESGLAKTVLCIMTTRESMTDIQTHSPNHTWTAALLYPVQWYFKGIIICMRELTFVPRHFTFSTLQGQPVFLPEVCTGGS